MCCKKIEMDQIKKKRKINQTPNRSKRMEQNRNHGS